MAEASAQAESPLAAWPVAVFSVMRGGLSFQDGGQPRRRDAVEWRPRCPDDRQVRLAIACEENAAAMTILIGVFLQ
jgi:hypothetical protein